MEFIVPVIYIAISQTFFAGILIATKRPTTIPNRLMAALLFMIFFDMIFAVIKINYITIYSFPFIAFTYGPILYLYVFFMTHPDHRFNFLNLLHFIPFIIFFVVSIVFRSDKIFTDLTGFFVSDKYIPLRIVYGASFYLSITTYSIMAFLTIRNHQRHLKDLISYASSRVTLNWLKIISISFYATYVLFFILGGLNIFINFLPFDPYYTIFVFVAVFSMVYSFYAIKQPVIVGALAIDDESLKNDTLDSRKEQLKEDTGNANGKSSRYSRSGLNDVQAKKNLIRLLAFMDEKRPYLDRDLSIYDLSNMTGISRHHITEVLNEVHGRNFFTFINEYRVKEVIERMKDPENSNFTILAIAYDSGFNSKSTFNTFFKSMTGVTPTLYMKSLKL